MAILLALAEQNQLHLLCLLPFRHSSKYASWQECIIESTRNVAADNNGKHGKQCTQYSNPINVYPSLFWYLRATGMALMETNFKRFDSRLENCRHLNSILSNNRLQTTFQVTKRRSEGLTLNVLTFGQPCNGCCCLINYLYLEN